MASATKTQKQTKTTAPKAAKVKKAAKPAKAAKTAKPAKEPKPAKAPKVKAEKVAKVGGKIAEILELHKQGMSNKEIIEKGFNKSTVSIQCAKFKRENPNFKYSSKAE